MVIESISTLGPMDDLEEISKITTEPIKEKKEILVQEALNPKSMIQGQRPPDLICLLKYKLDLAGEKYQKETGRKITPNEWEAQLRGNLRGMVFERLSSLIPVNSADNMVFTTQTETHPISVSSIQPLKKVTRFYENKSALINSITEDRAKQLEMQATTVIPDNLLVGSNDEIVGFVEDKCYTPDEIQDLAQRLEKDPSDFINTLDKEIEFLKLAAKVREEKLGIGTKPEITKDRVQLPQQPEINRNSITVVLRFPADSPVDSVRKIGVILAKNDYQIEIQTLPFTSEEVNIIGKTLIKEHAAMIHYGVGNPSFPKKEIEIIESYVGITDKDIRNNLSKVAGTGKDSDISNLTTLSLLEKL